MPVLIALVVLAMGCHHSDYLSYSWDDRRILCSDAIDDYQGDAPWALVDDELGYAQSDSRVALFHAHRPGVTISIDGIERILSHADAEHLDYITYRELVPGPGRSGLALAFDDNSIEEWLGIRDLLASHHARVTFFITRYAILTDDERAGIDLLASDGHDIQPHTVTHPHGLAYVHDYGLQAYVDDEAVPSMDVLRAAGYEPTAFAYPFGEHTDAMDQALIPYVDKLRVSPGSCPW
jgi:peptidoglycan/xylan/chitin deacetylase (PgdA/CDA1 family)